MEFYNEKLLPKGLPELMGQFMPEEHYGTAKVIAYRRKAGGMLAQVMPNKVSQGCVIQLYPTMMASNGGRAYAYDGTRSFKLWMAFLFTALHEIGHLATWEQRASVDRYDEKYGVYGYPSWGHWRFVEGLADAWATRAIQRIKAVDDRVGMPDGALTGYPGALIHRQFGNHGHPWGNELDHHRIREWRAMRCNAQVTLGDVIGEFWGRHQLYFTPELAYGASGFWEDSKSSDTDRLRSVCRARVSRELHSIARQLGITRHFTNKAGTRRYLMFNSGEADRVKAELGARQWDVLCWIDARVKRQQKKDKEQAGAKALHAVTEYLQDIASLGPKIDLDFQARRILETIQRYAKDMTEGDTWPTLYPGDNWPTLPCPTEQDEGTT